MNDVNNSSIARSRKRRRSRKRKPIPGMLSRLTSFGVALVVAVTLIAVFARKVAEPYALGASQHRQIASLQDQLSETRLQNQHLQERRDALDRPEGIEVAARSEGYLRKGEARLVLEHDPSPMPDHPQIDSLLDRWRSAWFELVGR